ncbi:mucoidy inhibitor MuiA family protein [Pseudotenacibaculum sp. MALMAid0570]|uniref:mucoidy inhibitor MuiA family protein n=1 Tax=Pseudotenacibaculum sp. MALMAid0570 TaxID=3143938 RepID=UPI0032DFE68B
MKKVIVFLLFLTVNPVFSQDKEIKSKVNSATVFLNSAQVTRTKNVQLKNGIQVLKFVELSPFIDKKSIQVKAKDIEIQSINFQKNYLTGLKKNETRLSLEDLLLVLDDKIDLENINLSSIQDEIQFLKSNRSIGGNQTLTVNALKEASTFYSSQMKNLKTKELTVKNRIKKLQKEKTKIRKQINDLTPQKEFASGEIYIKVKSNSIKTIQFQLTYNVSNVGWYPSYDIRVKDINSPLYLTYKANLKQNSQVDWNNVKLSFSSANPSQSTKAGKITPYFLDYGSFPPNYKGELDEIFGYVRDSEGPLIGASVIVKGTTIGTETDWDGRYSIKVPDNNSTLVFSHLGFKTVERRAYNRNINVTMEASEVLDEVVVTAYASSNIRRKPNAKLSQKLQGKAYGLSSSIPTKKIINQTSVSFEIIEPYTIKSSNKDFVISMKSYQSAAKYNYYAVPRIEENAFLVASLGDWEKFNLLEGEANVYFENTFIGTTLIDTRFTENQLDISLGMDKNVSVQRTKAKDFTTRQFIGSKQEETSVWDFTIKNNKTESIQMTVLDQIPVSTREEIRIDLDKEFDGKLNKKTGEVEWKFVLTPKNTQKLKLKYSVRFPKNRRLIID